MSANLAIRLLVSRTSGQELFSYDATGFEQFEIEPALCSNGNGNGNSWLVRPKTIKKKDLWWRQELLSTGNLGSGFILAVIVQPQHKGPEKIFLLIRHLAGLGGVDSDGIVLYQINDNGCLKEVNLPKKQLISDLGCIPTMLYRHLFSGDLGLWPMLTKLGADIWRFQGNTQSLTTDRIFPNNSKTRKIIDDERARLLNEVILKLKVDIAWTTSEDVNQHIRSYQRKIQDEYNRIKRADEQRRAAASEPLVKRIK